MEHGLRECLLSVRLGHILIQHSRDADRKKIDPQVYFSHLPPHIEARPVLLMDPIVGTPGCLRPGCLFGINLTLPLSP